MNLPKNQVEGFCFLLLVMKIFYHQSQRYPLNASRRFLRDCICSRVIIYVKLILIKQVENIFIKNLYYVDLIKF